MRKKVSTPQEILICPVCGKEFKKNEDTKYIISGGYTCSWKCFSKEAKRRTKEYKENLQNKNNKKRNK
jgi:hypothetical protein